jgi:hypothetical protein
MATRPLRSKETDMPIHRPSRLITARFELPLKHVIAMLVLVLGMHGVAAQEASPKQETSTITAEAAEQEKQEGFLPLFDGQLLTNWEGKAYWFRVEDSAIVAGRLDEPIPHNYFLCTTRKYGDFELRLQVKAVGEGVNAGIQFRTKRIPGSDEVSGYQADVGGVADNPVWGALYDESRRKRMLAQPSSELVNKIVRKDGWNDYTIRCVGPKIELFLNGEQTVDYTETDGNIETDGVIALQIHSGPPSEAWYRNLRIKPL